MTKIPQRLPVLMVEAETCGEAWEKTLEAVWVNGIEIEHHYDQDDEDEKAKMSKEASVTVNITNPLAEPRFSRKDFISVTLFMTGVERKKPYRQKKYVQEVLDGILDHRVEQGIEAYTYHERLRRWGLPQPKHQEMLKKKGLLLKLENPRNHSQTETVNQIEMLIQKAREEPISRKLQMTTWQPHKDLLISGAPCLQRIWIRIIDGKYMVMEVHWRSRDLLQAWGSNILAMVELGKMIADELGLEFTQLVDSSNSLHIYGKNYGDVEKFFKTTERRRGTV